MEEKKEVFFRKENGPVLSGARGSAMLYSVGYQLRKDDDWTDAVLRHKNDVYEVYFAFGSYPNGRNVQTQSENFLPHEATARQLADLGRIAGAGIPLNILFNGNCYGKDAQSRQFFSIKNS